MSEYSFRLAEAPSARAVDIPTWERGSLLALTAVPSAQRRRATSLLYIDDPEIRPHHLPTGSGIGASHDPSEDLGIAAEIKCYFAKDVAVSGNGLLWLGEDLLILDDIMPSYWRDMLSGHSGQSTPETDIHLPIRTIKDPCICGLGWGAKVYGHVLLEILPRILLAYEATRQLATRPRLLLRTDTPGWALSIFSAAGIDRSWIKWFDPARERVRLEHGIYPANVGTTHPYLSMLFEGIDKDHINQRSGDVYYLTRKAYPDRRACVNEPDLEHIATDEFGAVVVAPERMSWMQQVRLFRSANAIVGLTGSALHTALVSDGGLTVASIGAINRMQSAIGNLRGQRMAYQVAGFTLSGSYSVPVDGFRRMMEAVCNLSRT